MEYCSPLWAGAPAFHLSRLHAAETKAFRITGISRDEAESLGLSLCHCRQVGGLSVFYRLLSGLAPPPPPCSVCEMSPPYFRRALRVRPQPPSGKTTKIKNQCSTSLFHSSFSPPLEKNSLTLFNPILPSRPSKQLFTTTSYRPPSKTTICSTPIYPPQTHLLQIPCFSS